MVFFSFYLKLNMNIYKYIYTYIVYKKECSMQLRRKGNSNDLWVRGCFDFIFFF